jgi:hypothetical protein
MSILDWVWNNKEWIFSGIGVFVLWVIWALLRRKSRKSESQAQQAQPSIAHVPSTRTIRDVLNDISSRPPYQQDQARTDYLGLRIQFSGQFSHLSRRENDVIWV